MIEDCMTSTSTDLSTAEPHIDPLLRGRWSGRVFDARHELDDADLARLLEAARWSPSAGNSQPWSFIVTKRGEVAHAALTDALSKGNTSWVPAASAVLITLRRVGDDEDPALTFSDYAAYDLGQSVAHLSIQAESMGLSTHQFAGFDHGRVAELFRVPAAWRVTTAVAIGVRPAADELPLPRVRKDLSEFVFTDQFGTPRWC